MRMNFTLAIAAIGVVAFASCSKSAQEETVLSAAPSIASQVVNVKVETNGVYELAITGSMGEVKVHAQALHYELSELGIDSKNSRKVYKYIPAKDYNGSDEVTLSQTRSYTSYGESGQCHNGNMSAEKITRTSTTFLTIKFKVTPKT
jgi:hypothetical protein